MIDGLTRGNPTEVKVLLASVALGLAVYQLVLIAVGDPIAVLLVAAVIVAIGIAVVTSQFGSTSAAERELQEERLEQQDERR